MSDSGATDAARVDAAPDAFVLDSGTADAGSPDSGPVIRPGDTLIVEGLRGEVPLQNFPGGIRCMRAQIIHGDGTREAVSSGLRVEVEDVAVAQPAPASDCRAYGDWGVSLVGVIGVAEGETTVRVSYERDGMRLVGAIRTQTQPYRMEVDLLSGVASLFTTIVNGAVGLGGSYAGHVVDAAGASVSSEPSMRAAPSTVEVVVADPIAEAIDRPGRPWGKAIVGTAAGMSSFRIRYGLPSHVAELGPFSLRVLPQTSSSLPGLSSTEVEDARSVTGRCFRVLMTGIMQEDLYTSLGNFQMERDYTWEALGPDLMLTESGNPALFCPTAPGETDIRGCFGGRCSDLRIVHPASAVESLRFVPDTVSLTVRERLESPGGLVVCPGMRVEASMADGSSIDITGHPRTTYGLANFEDYLDTSWHFSAIRPTSPTGELCWEITSGSVCPTETELILRLEATYLEDDSNTALGTLTVSGWSLPSACSM
ncbi:MAG: hypothetical protein GXP55_15775 [Deltaproteobacteria bacterium]|nr:hypothetical protein [Deltaproteobacteria bacterium]